MTKPFLLLLAAMSVALTTGCAFIKGDRKPKESSAIASEVEETFRRRWLDKRVAELTARGVAPDAARAQAEAQFRDQFGFPQRPKK